MTMTTDSYDPTTGALCALLYGPVTEPCAEERTALRVLARCYRPARVVVEDGWSPPRREGSRGYYTTLSGRTVVHHPGAYGWPTLYHRSTLRCIVGRAWLVAWRRNGGVYRAGYAAGVASNPLLRALCG